MINNELKQKITEFFNQSGLKCPLELSDAFELQNPEIISGLNPGEIFDIYVIFDQLVDENEPLSARIPTLR